MKISDIAPGINQEQARKSYMDWQQRVIEAAKKANPEMAASFDFFGNVPLTYVPYKQRVGFVSEVRRILHHDSIISGLEKMAPEDIVPPQRLIDKLRGRATSVAKVMDQMIMRGSDSEYGNLPISSGRRSGFLDNFYSVANLQFSDNPSVTRTGNVDLARGIGDYFSIGSSSYPRISETSFQAPRRLSELAGKSLMVMDIETAGLMRNATREVSYLTAAVDDSGGSIIPGETSSVYFRPRQFRRGTIGFQENGVFKSLGTEEYTIKTLGLDAMRSAPTEGLGEDYARRMMPVLQQMMNSDYIVGHNIASFDIPYIFSSLAQTSAYLDDSQTKIPGFRDLVQSAHARVSSGSVNVIDTLDLARSSPRLRNIGIAEELARRGSGRPYSIENLLLMTNLHEKLDPNLTQRIVEKGLHSADVDSEVTLSLLQHMGSLRPRDRSIAGGILEDLKKSILNTSLITPTTNVPEVSDLVLRSLIKGKGNSVFIPEDIVSDDATRLRELLSSNSLTQPELEEAVGIIRSGSIPDISYKINPIEHEIIETRRLGLGAGVDLTREIDPSSLMFKVGLFDRLTGRGTNYDTRSIRSRDYGDMVRNGRVVSAAEMAKFQESLVTQGAQLPWAGASFTERQIGTAISGITSSLGRNPAETRLGSLLSDSMTGIFDTFDPSTIQYLTESGRMTMHASILSKFGLLAEEDGAKPTMLGMSVVDPTMASSKSSLNIIYQFSDQDSVEKFIGNIEGLINSPNYADLADALGFSLPDTGMLSEEQEKIISRFRTEMTESPFFDVLRRDGVSKGIAIAQVTGDEAKPLVSLLGSIHGFDTMRDESLMPFRLPFMAKNISEFTGTGSLYTSGVVLDRGLSAEDVATHIPRNLSMARRHYKAMTELSSDPFALNMMRQYSNATSDEAMERIAKIFNFTQDHIRPNIGKALIAGVAAVSGGLLYKKHQENKIYNEPMKRMSTDSYSNYRVAEELQMKIDSGYNGYRQEMDPLATSFVVDNLNQKKIGHTNMGWDRNNNLYGGVL